MKIKIKHYILLAFVCLFIVSCGLRTSDIEQIKIINTENSEKNIIAKDSKTAGLIVKAINNKEKTTHDISKLFSYEILIDKKNIIEGYMMSFDIENQSVFISKDDLVYKTSKIIGKDLLLDENFSYVYIDNNIYNSYLNHNGENFNANVQYEWNYKNINGQLNKKEGTKAVEEETVFFNEGDTLDIIYSKNPDSQIVRVYNEGEVIYTGKSVTEVLQNIQYDGDYLIESQAQWLAKDGVNSYGKQTISFMTRINKPADFTIVNKENYPGNILIIDINNLNPDETVKLSTEVVKTDMEVYSYKDRYISINPIDLYAKEGDYEIYAVFNEGKEDEYTRVKTLKVFDKSFKTQYLSVTEEMNETNNDNEAIAEFSKLVKPARTLSVEEKLWEGPFIMPVEGRLTTDFAEIRYVNNELSSSRHSGIDLAAPTGTDVKAPNNGVVTFAMNGLLSPGNTIVIDHGMGLFTSYYHLDSVLVKAGEKVKKGDIIGTVGSTGFSTGPHLHYAVSIYNTYVNTYQTLSGIVD